MTVKIHTDRLISRRGVEAAFRLPGALVMRSDTAAAAQAFAFQCAEDAWEGFHEAELSAKGIEEGAAGATRRERFDRLFADAFGIALFERIRVRPELEAGWEEALKATGVSCSIADALLAYLETGIPPFVPSLRFVVAMDLAAIVVCDEELFWRLPKLYTWVNNYWPREASGPGALDAWSRARQALLGDAEASALRDHLFALLLDAAIGATT